MEPTIYKPSIYKGTGVYKLGGGGEEYQEIQILGNKYKCKEINGYLWMCENLKYPIGTFRASKDESGYYYPNGNIENFDKHGYLYNLHAAKELIENIGNVESEWHVPTRDNYRNDLFNFIALSQTSRVGYYLKSTENWDSGTSIDILGFSVLASGRASATSNANEETYSEFGTTAYYWTSTQYSASIQYNVVFNTTNDISVASNGTSSCEPIRLCKKLE